MMILVDKLKRNPLLDCVGIDNLQISEHQQSWVDGGGTWKRTVQRSAERHGTISDLYGEVNCGFLKLLFRQLQLEYSYQLLHSRYHRCMQQKAQSLAYLHADISILVAIPDIYIWSWFPIQCQ